MNDDDLRELLVHSKRIAVVGLSDQPSRPSYGVAQYLQRHGYTIVPVNPFVQTVLGEQAYPNLHSIPGPIDIVDIFRRSDQVGPVVDEAIAVGAKAVWMQLGVVDEQAAQRAREAGLAAVVDRCLKIDHARLIH